MTSTCVTQGQIVYLFPGGTCLAFKPRTFIDEVVAFHLPMQMIKVYEEIMHQHILPINCWYYNITKILPTSYSNCGRANMI